MLYVISTGLLVPVVVLLIYFFIRAIILLIGFFAQYQTMYQTASSLCKELNSLSIQNISSLAERLPKNADATVMDSVSRLVAARDSEAMREKILAEYELAAENDIATSKTLSKMGPMLGLMGTLIPMGPALVGLATGDIATMAYNMQVAFATTVVGLFAAAVGFVTQSVKQRRYMRNINSLEFLSQFITENQSKICDAKD
ncbi:MAG: MotA/TolQ/ExbB proton channel family protein [Muribaculaceae bacterium]